MGDTVVMKKKDFIEEHKKLIKLLNKYQNKDLRKEAAEQAAEMKTMVGGVDLTEKKTIPDNYSEEVLNILEAMSFGPDVFLVGSNALRSQQYAGDYDAQEVVEMNMPTDQAAASSLRKEFQKIVARLQKMPDVYIMDIKAGVRPDWRILPEDAGIKGDKVIGYNYEKSVENVDTLLQKKIITPTEAADAKALLHRSPTVAQFLAAKDILKFHIVRWTPAEIAKNKKHMRDGSVYTLEEAFQSPAVAKLDLIALVQKNRYTDFSINYAFMNKGKALNPVRENIGESLQEDVDANIATGNYFKALKRQFALAKYKDDRKTMERLLPILNSDLGRLYQIISDIQTLEDVLSKGSLPTIKYEIDQFKSRLSNIYELSAYLRKEDDVVAQIQRILKMPRSKMAEPLSALGNKLNDILQMEAKKHI